MKKVLLIIVIALVLFQMIVMATAIDIGSAAIDRDGSTYNNTLIDKLNPSNVSGVITSIEIWVNENLEGCEVATFEETSTNVFSTRDTHTIGNVTAGSKQTFSGLSLDVEAGDYIGIWHTAGVLERTDGSGGYWYSPSDEIPCTDVTFKVSGAGAVLSLYGIGISYKWNTKTLQKWNTGVPNKWNGI